MTANTMDQEISSTSTHKHLLDWDELDTHSWFTSIGLPQYERQLRDNSIQGDTLCMLDADGLKTLGIVSVGQRLSLLKAIYYLKLAHNIPLDEDAYIPPSEAVPSASSTIEEIHTVIQEQATRLKKLEESNRTLTTSMHSCLNDITGLRETLGVSGEPSDEIRQHLQYLKNKAEAAVQPLKSEDHITVVNPVENSIVKNVVQNSLPTPLTSTPSPDSISTSSNSSKVTLEDPTWKVLPAALKKHRIKMDEWPHYAMFISFGPTGNRTKRRLDMHEKPLHLFKKLKEAKQNPAFLLKNMKDMKDQRSPVEQEGSAA